MNTKRDHPFWGNFLRGVLIVLTMMMFAGLFSSLFYIEEIPDNKDIVDMAERGYGIYAEDELTNTFESIEGVSYIKTFVTDGNIASNGNWCRVVTDDNDSVLEYGKNVTASTQGSVVLTNNGTAEGSIYVFETDLKWCGYDNYTTDMDAYDWAVKIALGNDSLTTNVDDYSVMQAYIVGTADEDVYYISSNRDTPLNSVPLSKGKWYNLRIEYNAEDLSYSIYVDNEIIESGIYYGNASSTTFNKVVVNMRSYILDGVIYLDNAYINAQ